MPDTDPDRASDERTADDAHAGAEEKRSPPRWLIELREASIALRDLLSAQIDLLGAEFRLARQAVHTAMIAALVATIFGVALGLTALALIGWALAQWFGSWPWAMGALMLLQVLGMVGAIVLFRRCLHWMTMPATRAEWRTLINEANGAGEDKGHGPDSPSR